MLHGLDLRRLRHLNLNLAHLSRQSSHLLLPHVHSCEGQEERILWPESMRALLRIHQGDAHAPKAAYIQRAPRR